MTSDGDIDIYAGLSPMKSVTQPVENNDDDDIDLYAGLSPMKSKDQDASDIDIYMGLSPEKPRKTLLCNGNKEDSLKMPPPPSPQQDDSNMSTFDLYSDLIDEENRPKETVAKLKESNTENEGKIGDLISKIENLQKENSSLQTQNVNLKQNISTLLKTAKLEIKRKDWELMQLKLRSRTDDHRSSFPSSSLHSRPDDRPRENPSSASDKSSRVNSNLIPLGKRRTFGNTSAKGVREQHDSHDRTSSPDITKDKTDLSKDVFKSPQCRRKPRGPHTPPGEPPPSPPDSPRSKVRERSHLATQSLSAEFDKIKSSDKDTTQEKSTSKSSQASEDYKKTNHDRPASHSSSKDYEQSKRKKEDGQNHDRPSSGHAQSKSSRDYDKSKQDRYDSMRLRDKKRKRSEDDVKESSSKHNRRRESKESDKSRDRRQSHEEDLDRARDNSRRRRARSVQRAKESLYKSKLSPISDTKDKYNRMRRSGSIRRSLPDDLRSKDRDQDKRPSSKQSSKHSESKSSKHLESKSSDRYSDSKSSDRYSSKHSLRTRSDDRSRRKAEDECLSKDRRSSSRSCEENSDHDVCKDAKKVKNLSNMDNERHSSCERSGLDDSVKDTRRHSSCERAGSEETKTGDFKNDADLEEGELCSDDEQSEPTFTRKAQVGQHRVQNTKDNTYPKSSRYSVDSRKRRRSGRDTRHPEDAKINDAPKTDISSETLISKNVLSRDESSVAESTSKSLSSQKSTKEDAKQPHTASLADSSTQVRENSLNKDNVEHMIESCPKPSIESDSQQLLAKDIANVDKVQLNQDETHNMYIKSVKNNTISDVNQTTDETIVDGDIVSKRSKEIVQDQASDPVLKKQASTDTIPGPTVSIDHAAESNTKHVQDDKADSRLGAQNVCNAPELAKQRRTRSESDHDDRIETKTVEDNEKEHVQLIRKQSDLKDPMGQGNSEIADSIRDVPSSAIDLNKNSSEKSLKDSHPEVQSSTTHHAPITHNPSVTDDPTTSHNSSGTPKQSIHSKSKNLLESLTKTNVLSPGMNKPTPQKTGLIKPPGLDTKVSSPEKSNSPPLRYEFSPHFLETIDAPMMKRSLSQSGEQLESSCESAQSGSTVATSKASDAEEPKDPFSSARKHLFLPVDNDDSLTRTSFGNQDHDFESTSNNQQTSSRIFVFDENASDANLSHQRTTVASHVVDEDSRDSPFKIGPTTSLFNVISRSKNFSTNTKSTTQNKDSTNEKPTQDSSAHIDECSTGFTPLDKPESTCDSIVSQPSDHKTTDADDSRQSASSISSHVTGLGTDLDNLDKQKQLPGIPVQEKADSENVTSQDDRSLESGRVRMGSDETCTRLEAEMGENPEKMQEGEINRESSAKIGGSSTEEPRIVDKETDVIKSGGASRSQVSMEELQRLEKEAEKALDIIFNSRVPERIHQMKKDIGMRKRARRRTGEKPSRKVTGIKTKSTKQSPPSKKSSPSKKSPSSKKSSPAKKSSPSKISSPSKKSSPSTISSQSKIADVSGKESIASNKDYQQSVQGLGTQKESPNNEKVKVQIFVGGSIDENVQDDVVELHADDTSLFDDDLLLDDDQSAAVDAERPIGEMTKVKNVGAFESVRLSEKTNSSRMLDENRSKSGYVSVATRESSATSERSSLRQRSNNNEQRSKEQMSKVISRGERRRSNSGTQEENKKRVDNQKRKLEERDDIDRRKRPKFDNINYDSRNRDSSRSSRDSYRPKSKQDDYDNRRSKTSRRNDSPVSDRRRSNRTHDTRENSNTPSRGHDDIQAIIRSASVKMATKINHLRDRCKDRSRNIDRMTKDNQKSSERRKPMPWGCKDLREGSIEEMKSPEKAVNDLGKKDKIGNHNESLSEGEIVSDSEMEEASKPDAKHSSRENSMKQRNRTAKRSPDRRSYRQSPRLKSRVTRTRDERRGEGNQKGGRISHSSRDRDRAKKRRP